MRALVTSRGVGSAFLVAGLARPSTLARRAGLDGLLHAVDVGELGCDRPVPGPLAGWRGARVRPAVSLIPTHHHVQPLERRVWIRWWESWERRKVGRTR